MEEPALKTWHTVPAEEAVRILRSDPMNGLSDAEAVSRAGSYGANVIRQEKSVSPFEIFLRQFKSVLIIILLISTLVSALLGQMVDAFVIAIIVALVAVAGFAQEYRAERVFSALKKRLGMTCVVLREGKRRAIDTAELVPGDIVILEAGNSVPADVRLVEVAAQQIDESALTGESLPVEKSVAPLPLETVLADRTNMAFSGTVVTYGRAKGVVIATGIQTEFGRIVKDTLEVPQEETPLEKRINEIGKRFGAIAMGVISIVAIVEVMRVALTGDLTPSALIAVLLFGISLGVAAVPEALPAIVTTTLAIGMRILSRNNALVRSMSAVETLGSTEIICFDKTGTLTRGEMTVTRLHAGKDTFDVTGAGYNPEGLVLLKGEQVYSQQEPLTSIARAALLCNDAVLENQDGSWRVVGDPTEGSLLVLARKMGLDPGESGRLPRVAEIPFSSERKLMTTIHRLAGGQIIAYMKGAPEIVLQHCSSRLLGEDTRELLDEDKAELSTIYDRMSRDGLRVLAMAMKRFISEPKSIGQEIESGFAFLGLVGMEDPLREDAVEAVRRTKDAGMKPIMITGDHKLTAVAVAERAGIYRPGDSILIGRELEHLTESELENRVQEVTVYARISPLDKLKIVNAWKKGGRVVAMTGDGVNDAPALRRADIGVAMGMRGTDVARQAADIVLTDDDFATMVKAVELGRWIYDNIKKYLAYLLQANLVEIAVLGFIALLIVPVFGLRDTLPLLPVQILYINLATDGLPALALGFSPPDPDLFTRPPRRKDEPVFTRELSSFLITTLLLQTPVLVLAFTTGLVNGLDAARTRLFLMFIFMELALALNCRSLTLGIKKARPHLWLLLATAWESALILLLFQIPQTREALHVTLPTIQDAYWILAATLIAFAGGEWSKRFDLAGYITRPFRGRNMQALSGRPQ